MCLIHKSQYKQYANIVLDYNERALSLHFEIVQETVIYMQ